MRITNITLRTDHKIEARRPDLVVINEKENSSCCQLIDVAVAKDGRVRVDEDKKVKRQQDLVREVRRTWGLWIKVVVGVLETIPRRLKENFWVVGVKRQFDSSKDRRF